MKIAILTSGILPIPAVQGGAVENLIDFYLEYNDKNQLHDITIYSVYHPKVSFHQALKSTVNHYHYINTTSIVAKVQKWIYHLKNSKNEYYHYSIEFFLEKIIKHIRKQSYDIIIIENRPAFALKIRKVTNAKLVYHIHNEKLHKDSAFAKEIYDAASLIINVSDYITNRVKSICPVDNKAITIYNGIDLSSFSRTPFRKPNKKQMGIQESDFILLYSGRIVPEKGITELIEALKNLKQYPIKLLVIGSSFFDTNEQNDQFTISLKTKTEDIKDKVIFTGFIPYSQMPQYLQLANVAVFPSIWDDPLPTTVLEAQAMGLPIITTKRGGIPEEVTDRNAILLKTDEHFIDNLATAILDLYNNPEKRKQMSEIAIQRAHLFDKDKYAASFINALETKIPL